MRFADIFGKGLVGALTDIDLTDMVTKGGLVGAATGVNLADGGLEQLPYTKGQRLHGIADFDGNYNPTYEIPGRPITPEEKQRMNEMYPIGNIGK